MLPNQADIHPVTATDVVKSNNAIHSRKMYRNAFLTDEEISNSYVFSTLEYCMKKVVLNYFDISVEGSEKLCADKAYLFITFHSFHNQDIVPGIFALYFKTGKVMRGLMHRILYSFSPLAKYFGFTPGDRKVAIELLKSGHWVAVIPGGGEEAIAGHENAYKLHWYSSSGRKRLGWAHVAKEANVAVVPMVGVQTQEMAFNIFSFLCNALYISHGYDYLLGLPGVLGWFFYQVKVFLWFMCCTFLSIPLPIRSGVAMGDPISFHENETVEQFADRTERKFQQLIDAKNPGGIDYTRALKSRFSSANVATSKND